MGTISASILFLLAEELPVEGAQSEMGGVRVPHLSVEAACLLSIPTLGC